jgi:hypothetical protein
VLHAINLQKCLQILGIYAGEDPTTPDEVGDLCDG